MGSPRLRSLQIHKYRHVVPGTRLEFGESFNVLLGRNGTGKTTLLELIEMIWAKGFGQIADEPFHLEYSVEFDDVTYPIASRYPPVPGCLIHVEVENATAEDARQDSRHFRSSSPPLEFRYHVTVATLAGEVMVTVEGTPTEALMRTEGRSARVPVLAASAWPVVWIAPAQYNYDNSTREDGTTILAAHWADLCRFILSYLDNTGRYDESLSAFHALTSTEYRLMGSGLHGARWEIARRLDQETKAYHLDDNLCVYFPRQLLERWYTVLANDPRREPPEFHDSIRDTDLAVFLELTGYSDVIVRSGTPARERITAVERLKFGPPEFRILLPNNRGEIPAQALSYGEKRLLSFLWHLACNPSVIIADELVNGFHHAWIERCVELIGTRQAFLASQNPLLLDCLPLASEEYVRGCFITCRRNADGQMSWTNLSAEEAADFYRSYERQTRYTHEILRSKGLW